MPPQGEALPVSEQSRLTRFLARTVWTTRFVDRLYGKFDTLRSRLILRHGSDAFHDAFNDATYGGQRAYRPGSAAFKTDLFPWEARIIDAHFPKPPASLLIGGAGGGREALALEARGYAVIAFEPAPALAAAFHDSLSGRTVAIEVLVGRYQDLPVLHAVAGSKGAVDLRQRAPFDAAIIGWSSFSHIRTDAGRVETLRQMAALTRGPILLSYFSMMEERVSSPSRRESFAMQVGFFRQLTEADVRGMVEQAGLELIAIKHGDGWPCAVVRQRSGPPLPGTEKA